MCSRQSGPDGEVGLHWFLVEFVAIKLGCLFSVFLVAHDVVMPMWGMKVGCCVEHVHLAQLHDCVGFCACGDFPMSYFW